MYRVHLCIACEGYVVAKKTTTQNHPLHPLHPLHKSRICQNVCEWMEKAQNKDFFVTGVKGAVRYIRYKGPVTRLGEIRKLLSEKKCLISPRTRYKGKITISGGFCYGC